jgi:hypothetical protein
MPSSGRSGVEDREARAVEPDEPFLRAEPEVAVRCLGQRHHGVLGQPLLGLPDVVDVLGDRLARVEGRGPADHSREQSQAQDERGPGREGPQALLQSLRIASHAVSLLPSWNPKEVRAARTRARSPLSFAAG